MRIYPILLYPNTRNLYLLLFHTTVSLDFRYCLISELIIQSPRMVNNSTMHSHPTRCDVTMHMKCNYVISCDIMLHAQYELHATFQHMDNFFLHIIHIHQQSMLYISTQYFHTQHVIWLSNNTQMALISGPQKQGTSRSLHRH